jgi:hypothetical protein
MLAAMDSIEIHVAESCAALRAEAEALLAALEKARTRTGSRNTGANDAWVDDPDDSLAELLFGD